MKSLKNPGIIIRVACQKNVALDFYKYAIWFYMIVINELMKKKGGT